MRRTLPAFALISVALLAACNGGGSANSAAAPNQAQAPPAATPAVSEAPSQAPGSAPGSSPTPVTVPTPTPNPNLLDVVNGTILRSYSPPQLDGMNDGNLGNAAEGIGSELPDAAKPPFVFTFELPGPAKIIEFEAALRGADTGKGEPPSTVAVAVSTTSASDGFHDVGTLSGGSDGSGGNKILTANVDARWVRVTANRLFDSVGATGTVGAPPAGLNPSGYYIMESVPDLNGAFVMSGRKADDWRSVFVMVGSDLVATQCNGDSMPATFVGTLAGRNWVADQAGTKDANPDKVRAVVNDDASIVAGRGNDGGGSPYYFMRTTDKPKFCGPRPNGTGIHHFLVLDQDAQPGFWPTDASSVPAPYSFTAIGAGMLDAAALTGQEGVITRGVCHVSNDMGPAQIALLQSWIAQGHKLILGNSGCNDPSDYAWFAYPFTSAGAGPDSAKGSVIQAENDALGTSDKNDAEHFVDLTAYDANQGGNAAGVSIPMTTTDAHWCGHLFAAKTTNVNGFIQSYAVDGKGVAIYDGFSDSDNGQSVVQRIRQLELALPVPSDLPCTQLATEAFLLVPSQEAAFDAGTARTIRAPMQVLANQGFNGHITVSASGGFPTTVKPSSFDLSGVQQLDVAVAVPASAKAGVSTVTVTGDNGQGKTAAATVTLTGTASLKKVFAAPAKQKRIRIYGIHFDVDSARIQPRSAPVIADIASVMRSNPTLHFRIEGYTDSDGGAAYNLGLSQRRAQAVVDELVAHYGIARSRLVAAGFGLTHPVASNATPAGKALNRRVELVVIS
ncbi:MAG TPA: OmpA family protein [Candidatus Acidoferrales bacterium]|nr:OmpA family protein [Candidatus Acidoferrales bacterium]